MIFDNCNNSCFLNLVISSAVFLVVLLLVFFLTTYLFKRLKRYVKKTPNQLDDFILELFRVPALWFLFWILFKIFSVISLNEFAFAGYLAHINTVLLILSVGWILTKFIKAGAYYLQNNLDVNSPDNLHARKSLTQIKVFQNIANSIIIIVALSISLLTFDEARTIGMSLLTSAGILGIIVGFAAQKSIGMILAGIQIAITQPIRLDDVVVVEKEWGRIEEITLTYVVVKIWDERRLILPITWFLENPFQNWTRTGSEIIGSVFLYVDYSLPIADLRTELDRFLKNNQNWDGRVMNIQVTEASDKSKELRILLSSADASKNWDLRAEAREHFIDFINSKYPNAFARLRITNQCR